PPPPVPRARSSPARCIAPACPCRQCRSQKVSRQLSLESGTPAVTPAQTRSAGPWNKLQTAAASPPPAETQSSDPIKECSTQSRSESSAASLLPPAQSCGQEMSRQDSM